MLIDTHAHLDFPEFRDDLEAVLVRAKEAGVTRIITIGTSIEGSRNAIRLAESHPCVFAAVGIHPGEVLEAEASAIDDLRELVSHPRVVAIGETGLDYHRLPSHQARHTPSDVMRALGTTDTSEAEGVLMDHACKAAQQTLFRNQLELAAELGLNVVVHQRDAWNDTLEIIRPFQGKLRAVFHCFADSPEQAGDLVQQGHLVSFTGIVTFKNAEQVRDVLRGLRKEDFMVETDCPYLAPVPFRGKRCEPAHVRETAQAIADLRKESLEEVAEYTSRNADGFFRFG